MPKLSIRDLDLAGKRVFVRVDFNVPITDGRIGDDTRMQASLPTIAYALDHGATVVLASHLGRPKGAVNPQLSLRPIAATSTVADVLEAHGDRADRILRRYGLYCLGCQHSTADSLEMAARQHGLEPKRCDLLIKELNQAFHGETVDKRSAS